MSYESNNPKTITLNDDYALENVSEKIGQILSLTKGQLDINSMLTITNEVSVIKPEIYAKKNVVVIDLTKCKIYAKVGLIFKPMGGKVQRILVEKHKITVEVDGLYDCVIPVKS